jgi:hypothetical protein
MSRLLPAMIYLRLVFVFYCDPNEAQDVSGRRASSLLDVGFSEKEQPRFEQFAKVSGLT